MTKNGLRTLLNISTSLLLKLAHHTMHKGETWYACIFQCFYDDYQQKMSSGHLNITTSSPLKLAHHTMHGGETLYACVFKCFHDDYQQKMPSGTFPYNYLKKEAYSEKVRRQDRDHTQIHMCTKFQLHALHGLQV